MLLLTPFQSKSIKRKDESGNEVEVVKPLWYPRIVKFGDNVTSDELSEEIAEISSLSPGDVKSLVKDMFGVIKKHLLDGKSVFLDGFGSFTVTCNAKGTGVETKEEVNPNQITQLNVRFTPTATHNSFEGTTRAIFHGVTFKMISKEEAQKIEGGGGDGFYSGDPNDDGIYIDPNA
jgi:predicted histone-like DNA-binding protein